MKRNLPRGHHKDRDGQYSSHDDQKILRQHGFKVSTYGKGNCYGNSAVVILFKTIKAELIWRRSREIRRQAEMAVFRYINGLHNSRRRHTTPGWKALSLTNGRWFKRALGAA